MSSPNLGENFLREITEFTTISCFKFLKIGIQSVSENKTASIFRVKIKNL